MFRKMIITVAAIALVGAMVGLDVADARGFGGGFRGGGFRGGGFGGGGLRSAFVGGGFRGVGFRRGFVGPGRFAFRPGLGFRRFGFFPRRRFAFAAVPFGIGLGYGASCWRWVPTAWGWERAWVCGYGGWGYGGWGGWAY
jgi:hypothetical protein